ncbi:MBL fold metallo-hydrolase, partial [Methylobacterium frigidaeris]
MTIRLDAPNRRGLMLGAAAAAVTAGLPGAAGAKAPMLRSQSPYYYRFTLGDAEATMVSDGTLPLGDPHANFLGLTPAEMDAQLNSNFLPLSNAVLEQNILILNTGSKLVLFDTGMGSLKLFGPTTGKLLTTMRQAGI